MVRRLFTLLFGIGVGVGLGASIMHKIDKAAQAAAAAASPRAIAQRAGVGVANVANKFGQGWRETRGSAKEVQTAEVAEFTVRPVRDLRAG